MRRRKGPLWGDEKKTRAEMEIASKSEHGNDDDRGRVRELGRIQQFSSKEWER